MKEHEVNGLLLLYHHPLASSAPTIWDHVAAFKCYSQFRVWNVNTELGFPEGLKDLRFQIIVLHYSLFGVWPYELNGKFLDYLEQCQSSYKIAFLQDEYRYCQQRFAFLNRFQVDCVYTLFEPAHFDGVYGKYTNVPKLVYTLAGYVSEELIGRAHELTMPDTERELDVGYRARRLPFYMGQGAQAKYEIAVGFCERAQGLGLRLDIETDERKRIYGSAWYGFLANCRAVLGVEGGVSIVDLEDIVRTECQRLLALNPFMDFTEISQRVLQHWEGNIPYSMITPRHFEAAALRVCQILFEGAYSGMMQPLVHYIPLKKDFSNFDEVIRMFKDAALRRELTTNAYRDLVASGRFSYRRFIEEFDSDLLRAGMQPAMPHSEIEKVASQLSRGKTHRQLLARLSAMRSRQFRGRRAIAFMARPGLRLFRRLRQRTLARYLLR